MKEIKIKINNQEFIIKQSFRALMLFEQLTGRSSNDIKENISDLITLFYCILKAANKQTFTFQLDEFVDYLDENQDKIEVFNNYLTDIGNNNPKTNKKKVIKN